MMGRIALMVGLGLSAAASASDETTRLRFRKDLDRGAAAGEAILAAPLDGQIHAATRDGYPDLRLLDDRDAEVPYVIQTLGRTQTVVHHEVCPSRVASLSVKEGEALEVVVALDEKAPAADGATVHTPLTDFERRVRVYGDRGGEWILLKEAGRIFDYSRFMDVRSTEIALPTNNHRRFKFVIEQETDEHASPFRELIRGRIQGERDRDVEITTILRRPFRIDRIELWRNVTSVGSAEEESFTYPAALLHVETDAKEKTTTVEIESGRRPLTGLRLQTASRNFSPPARVLAPLDFCWAVRTLAVKDDGAAGSNGARRWRRV